MADLRFEGQTVIVTGAGGGLGKAYAVFFGSRGANVVVNDLGKATKREQEKGPTMAADVVVEEIRRAGGRALANYDSVDDGEKLVEAAMREYGRVDVLINNAGIIRDVSFENMTDTDWDLITRVHMRGAYKCARAVWPHFKKQRSGRIINTASAAGLFGNFGQVNNSAAKMAQLGFTKTLAIEGSKYNILVNVIAPAAASSMTATILPPEALRHLRPECIPPVVGFLVHPSNTKITGSIFEIGGGHVSQIRFERACGALLKPDSTLTPGAILQKWDEVNDFSAPTHPTESPDFMQLLKEAQNLDKTDQGKVSVNLTGKVAVITGAGAGLGRSYALLFAKLGAAVIVNDIANPDGVVEEIRKANGRAVGIKVSVEKGEEIVDAAVKAFGRIDIVINNAGILRDKAFANMDDTMWDQVVAVHLRGTYKVTKAAWPYFLKQKYGRIVNTTSPSGIYGQFGQANYSAAKAAIIGFTRALALEGLEHNILVNAIAPNAGTNMTRSILTEEAAQSFRPDYVAPLVALLSSDESPKRTTGGVFEVGSGWYSKLRWQRSKGYDFTPGEDLSPEAVANVWGKITDFRVGSDNPSNIQEGMNKIMGQLQTASEEKPRTASNELILKRINDAMEAKPDSSEFSYGVRDIILYNLGVGAQHTDLPLVFEGDRNFHVLPTFGSIPWMNAKSPYDLEKFLPNDLIKFGLHGQHYLEIRKYPIPTSARLVSYRQLLGVADKGSAAVVVSSTTTRDAETNEEIFYNEDSVFIRGAGGFGGRPQAPSSVKPGVYKPPQRHPDVVVEEKTTPDSAALYRLSGDMNPLHIAPEFAKAGGFETPILHGLCVFGTSGKHIYRRFGNIKSISARFVGTTLPGQTLRIEMWKEGKRIIFQTKVVETGKLCLAEAGVELWQEPLKL